MMFYAQQKKLHKGFTLIELMVVMVIIGLMVSLVSVNFVGQSPDKKLEDATKKFNAVFELAAEYGLLNNLELGLKIEKSSYEFLVFNNDNWSPIEEQALLAQELPEGMILKLELDGLAPEEDSLFNSTDSLFDEESSFDERAKKKKKLPQVFVFSGGDFTPFQLTFTFKNQFDFEEEIEYQVTGLYTLPLAIAGPIYDGAS